MITLVMQAACACETSVKICITIGVRTRKAVVKMNYILVFNFLDSQRILNGVVARILWIDSVVNVFLNVIDSC